MFAHVVLALMRRSPGRVADDIFSSGSGCGENGSQSGCGCNENAWSDRHFQKIAARRDRDMFRLTEEKCPLISSILAIRGQVIGRHNGHIFSL
jgi:hypothetical protein